MKLPPGPLVALSVSLLFGRVFAQDTDQADRAVVASMLALGRPSLADSAASSQGKEPKLAEAVNVLREKLKQDAEA